MNLNDEINFLLFNVYMPNDDRKSNNGNMTQNEQPSNNNCTNNHVNKSYHENQDVLA